VDVSSDEGRVGGVHPVVIITIVVSRTALYLEEFEVCLAAAAHDVTGCFLDIRFHLLSVLGVSGPFD